MSNATGYAGRFAKNAATDEARAADDATLAGRLRAYADNLEREGRASVPQWMREAAARLDKTEGRS